MKRHIHSGDKITFDGCNGTFRFVCCACGLSHDISFNVIDGRLSLLFKAIRAKLLYSNLPTFHRPVFDRSLEVRPPFTTMGEIKDYGVKFSTLYEMLGEV